MDFPGHLPDDVRWTGATSCPPLDDSCIHEALLKLAAAQQSLAKVAVTVSPESHLISKPSEHQRMLLIGTLKSIFPEKEVHCVPRLGQSEYANVHG